MSAAGSFLIIAVNGFSVASFARLRASRMQLSSMRCCLASEFFVSVIFNAADGEYGDGDGAGVAAVDEALAAALGAYMG